MVRILTVCSIQQLRSERKDKYYTIIRDLIQKKSGTLLCSNLAILQKVERVLIQIVSETGTVIRTLIDFLKLKIVARMENFAKYAFLCGKHEIDTVVPT